MPKTTFPDDLVDGSARAEQIGVGYELLNPLPMMAAATNVALLGPAIAIGTMMGCVTGMSRLLGLPKPQFDVMTVCGPIVSTANSTTTITTSEPAPARPAPRQPKPAPKRAAASKTALAAKPAQSAKTAAGTKSVAKATGAVASGPTRPSGLEEPRAGKADDLKKITGIGPKLELVLNDLGIYHVDQISRWTKDEAAWVDEYLKARGRIARDDWVGQAGKLGQEA
ncbi:MAG: hypothetical protein AAFY56_12780 [Pseudomonadota bacterium]